MNEFLKTFTDYSDVYLGNFLTTLGLFLLSVVGCLVLGTLLAGFRVSPVPALRRVGAVYVNIVRNTPLTLVFFFLVFAAPNLGIGFEYLSPFQTAIVALTLYTAAFVCEVLRAGVNTVPAGQAEAARALGMTFMQVLTLIILPQAFRTIVPPLMSVLIAMLKNTTIASGFSVLEAGYIPFFMSEKGENQIYVLLWLTIGFLILITPLTVLQRRLEIRWAVSR